MEVFLTKTMSGALVPMDQEQEAFKRFKAGSVIRCDVKEMRNGQFFKKWWSLVKVAFDLWTETMPNVEFKGVEIAPNFDRFRKDLTVLSGFYDPVFNVRGEVRMEAKSLQWSKMDEGSFNDLYQKTLTTIISKIIPGRNMTEDELRGWADRVMDYA
ncbi:MAG: DUF1367 family protein [Pseudomonadota bacterium]